MASSLDLLPAGCAADDAAALTMLSTTTLELDAATAPPPPPTTSTPTPSIVVDDPSLLPSFRPPHFVWTLVLDLDETLITNCLLPTSKQYVIIVRPYARDFLATIRGLKMPPTLQRRQTTTTEEEHRPTVEFILWSAGERGHVERCLRILDPTGQIFDHAVCRGPWFTASAQPLVTPAGHGGMVALKNLSLLPGDRANSSVIVDDMPAIAVCCGAKGLVIPVFSLKVGAADTTMLWLKQLFVFVAVILAAEKMDRCGGDAGDGGGDGGGVTAAGTDDAPEFNFLGIIQQTIHLLRHRATAAAAASPTAVRIAQIIETVVRPAMHDDGGGDYVAKTMRLHPFTVQSILTTSTHLGPVKALVLDVAESDRVSKRLAEFLAAYSCS